jgi:precorrin-6B methylase 2
MFDVIYIDGNHNASQVYSDCNNAWRCLKKNGYLIFPIIGLSNRDKLLKFIKKNNIKYKIIIEKQWPLPKELYKYKKILYKLKNKKIINFDEKFGLLTTKTEIIYCK